MRIPTKRRVEVLPKLRTLLSCVLLVGFLSATNGFETDCGLDGTERCKIFSYDDLKNVEKNGLDKHYELMNDIHAPTNPPENFTPIGGSNDDGFDLQFRKSFDGNGYTIHNLLIDGGNSTNDAGQGLFAALAGRGEIRDLILKKPKVVGSGNVGALAAYTGDRSQIDNVVVKNPTVMGGKNVGGLVGHGLGEIRGSRVIGGRVKGIAGEETVGGLAGYIVRNGLVFGSSTENIEVSEGFDCGGMVGKSFHAVVSNAFATGIVSSCSIAGGLIGSNNVGNIHSSYFVGELKDIRRFSGGLVGLVDAIQWNWIEKNFAISEATGRVAKSARCLIGGIERGRNDDLEKNYCFSEGPGVDNSSKPGEIAVVDSPDYFHGRNKPLDEWRNPIWRYKANKYPFIKYFIVDSGGPYKGRVDKPLRLRRAIAPRNKFNYHWTVDNKKCSFHDDTVLKPSLTCTGNSKVVANVCLTVNWTDRLRRKKCTTATFEVPPTACSIPSCKNSAFLEEKRNNIMSILESITEETPSGFRFSSQFQKARNVLVHANPLTSARIDKARARLDEVSPDIANKVKLGKITKEEQTAIELKIKGILDEMDDLEAECCDDF